MSQEAVKNIKRATVLYWLMLIFVVGVLIWWFILLEKQNKALANFQIRQLNSVVDSDQSPERYQSELHHIKSVHKRNTIMYISEGLFFLSIIIWASIVVYRSANRQFRLQRQQQNFMMAVTHELKTPVSVACLNLETMLKYELDMEKQKKLIRNTLQETFRLNSLTNNILISSQLEGGGYPTTREELNLSDLLKDCMQDFKSRYPERLFSETIQEDVDLKGDALLLQMLINNLVENAIKYSPKNSSVQASLLKKKSTITLTITDQGMGIPDEEKKKIFNRFYRIGNEATRKTQGTGIGLWLCSIIIKSYNGDILVTNNTPAGTNFVINFY